MSKNRPIKDLLNDPYSVVRNSILIPCRSYEAFHKVYNTLLASSPDFHFTELVLKIDSYKELDKYQKLLDKSAFLYKFVIYPSFNGRLSLHHFFNDMFNVSSGTYIWILWEDISIVSGNWYSVLSNIDKLCSPLPQDNIFYINIPMNNGKDTNQIGGSPIITREWCNFFGSVSLFPNIDRWLYELAKGIGRYFKVGKDYLLIDFPKGNRVLSKAERKAYFYPELEKTICKFNK